MNQISQALKQVWQKIAIAITLLTAFSLVKELFGLSRSEFLVVLNLLAIVCVIYLLTIIGGHLSAIEENKERI